MFMENDSVCEIQKFNLGEYVYNNVAYNFIIKHVRTGVSSRLKGLIECIKPRLSYNVTLA